MISFALQHENQIRSRVIVKWIQNCILPHLAFNHSQSKSQLHKECILQISVLFVSWTKKQQKQQHIRRHKPNGVEIHSPKFTLCIHLEWITRKLHIVWLFFCFFKSKFENKKFKRLIGRNKSGCFGLEHTKHHLKYHPCVPFSPANWMRIIWSFASNYGSHSSSTPCVCSKNKCWCSLEFQLSFHGIV